MDSFGPKPRLRSLLDHFSAVEDPREAWRVAHPLQEVLLDRRHYRPAGGGPPAVRWRSQDGCSVIIAGQAQCAHALILDRIFENRALVELPHLLPV